MVVELVGGKYDGMRCWIDLSWDILTVDYNPNSNLPLPDEMNVYVVDKYVRKAFYLTAPLC